MDSMAPRLPGCYLLVVLGEPLCEDHKERIIQKVAKGLLSWDTALTECDLQHMEAVCQQIKSTSSDSELLIQHSTDKLAVEVLLNPQVFTLKQCLKNLLVSPTGHKQLIYAGYSFTGTGTWMLQDGVFKFQDFVELFQDQEVSGFLSGCPLGYITMHMHCSPIGEWTSTNLDKNGLSKILRIEMNPDDSPSGVQGAAALLDFLEEALSAMSVETEMASSPVVGNIRFNKPTLYVFPSGQGDCSLFGVTGFTMLIDGGFTPLPCFWNFVRHLERLDSIMVTRLNESNLWGVSSLFRKKVLKPVYPHIGYVFCNIGEAGTQSPAEELQKERNELMVSVIDVGQKFLGNLRSVGLSPHQCIREPCLSPLTLYHKVGHGTLDMFILSPPRDSRVLRDFLQNWSSNKDSFAFVKTDSASDSAGEVVMPISDVMSICCLLVWKPADAKENITRMLFPGSAPQSRIFEGLDKIKHLDVLRYPVCSRASLRPSNVLIEKPIKAKGVAAGATTVEREPAIKGPSSRLRSASPTMRKMRPAYVKQASSELDKGDSSDSRESPIHKPRFHSVQSKSVARAPSGQKKEQANNNRKASELSSSVRKPMRTRATEDKRQQLKEAKSPVKKPSKKAAVAAAAITAAAVTVASVAVDEDILSLEIVSKDKASIDESDREDEKHDSEKGSAQSSPRKSIISSKVDEEEPSAADEELAALDGDEDQRDSVSSRASGEEDTMVDEETVDSRSESKIDNVDAEVTEEEVTKSDEASSLQVMSGTGSAPTVSESALTDGEATADERNDDVSTSETEDTTVRAAEPISVPSEEKRDEETKKDEDDDAQKENTVSEEEKRSLAENIGQSDEANVVEQTLDEKEDELAGAEESRKEANIIASAEDETPAEISAETPAEAGSGAKTPETSGLDDGESAEVTLRKSSLQATSVQDDDGPGQQDAGLAEEVAEKDDDDFDKGVEAIEVDGGEVEDGEKPPQVEANDSQDVQKVSSRKASVVEEPIIKMVSEVISSLVRREEDDDAKLDEVAEVEEAAVPSKSSRKSSTSDKLSRKPSATDIDLGKLLESPKETSEGAAGQIDRDVQDTAEQKETEKSASRKSSAASEGKASSEKSSRKASLRTADEDLKKETTTGPESDTETTSVERAELQATDGDQASVVEEENQEEAGRADDHPCADSEKAASSRKSSVVSEQGDKAASRKASLLADTAASTGSSVVEVGEATPLVDSSTIEENEPGLPIEGDNGAGDAEEPSSTELGTEKLEKDTDEKEVASKDVQERSEPDEPPAEASSQSDSKASSRKQSLQGSAAQEPIVKIDMGMSTVTLVDTAPREEAKEAVCIKEEKKEQEKVESKVSAELDSEADSTAILEQANVETSNQDALDVLTASNEADALKHVFGSATSAISTEPIIEEADEAIVEGADKEEGKKLTKESELLGEEKEKISLDGNIAQEEDQQQSSAGAKVDEVQPTDKSEAEKMSERKEEETRTAELGADRDEPEVGSRKQSVEQERDEKEKKDDTNEVEREGVKEKSSVENAGQRDDSSSLVEQTLANTKGDESSSEKESETSAERAVDIDAQNNDQNDQKPIAASRTISLQGTGGSDDKAGQRKASTAEDSLNAERMASKGSKELEVLSRKSSVASVDSTAQEVFELVIKEELTKMEDNGTKESEKSSRKSSVSGKSSRSASAAEIEPHGQLAEVVRQEAIVEGTSEGQKDDVEADSVMAASRKSSVASDEKAGKSSRKSSVQSIDDESSGPQTEKKTTHDDKEVDGADVPSLVKSSPSDSRKPSVADHELVKSEIDILETPASPAPDSKEAEAGVLEQGEEVPGTGIGNVEEREDPSQADVKSAPSPEVSRKESVHDLHQVPVKVAESSAVEKSDKESGASSRKSSVADDSAVKGDFEGIAEPQTDDIESKESDETKLPSKSSSRRSSVAEKSSRKPSIGGIEETLEPLNTADGQGEEEDPRVDISKAEKSASRKSSVASGEKAELSSRQASLLSLDAELKEESTAPELALEAQVMRATVPMAEASQTGVEAKPKEVSSRKSSVAEASSRKSSVAESPPRKSSVAEAPPRKSSVAEASSRKSSVAEAPPRKSSVAEAPARKSSVAEASSRKSSVAEAPPRKSSVAEASSRKSSVAEAPPRKSSVAEASSRKSSVAEAPPQKSSVAEASSRKSSVAEAPPQKSSVAEASSRKSSAAEAPPRKSSVAAEASSQKSSVAEAPPRKSSVAEASSRKSSVAEAPPRKSSVAAEASSKNVPEPKSASSKPPSRKSSTVSEKEFIVVKVDMEGTEAQPTGIETTDLDTVEKELIKLDTDGARLETSHGYDDRVIVTPSTPMVMSRNASIQDSSREQSLQETEAQEEACENISAPSVTLKEEIEGSEKSSPVLSLAEDIAQSDKATVAEQRSLDEKKDEKTNAGPAEDISARKDDQKPIAASRTISLQATGGSEDKAGQRQASAAEEAKNVERRASKDSKEPEVSSRKSSVASVDSAAQDVESVIKEELTKVEEDKVTEECEKSSKKSSVSGKSSRSASAAEIEPHGQLAEVVRQDAIVEGTIEGQKDDVEADSIMVASRKSSVASDEKAGKSSRKSSVQSIDDESSGPQTEKKTTHDDKEVDGADVPSTVKSSPSYSRKPSTVDHELVKSEIVIFETPASPAPDSSKAEVPELDEDVIELTGTSKVEEREDSSQADVKSASSPERSRKESVHDLHQVPVEVAESSAVEKSDKDEPKASSVESGVSSRKSSVADDSAARGDSVGVESKEGDEAKLSSKSSSRRSSVAEKSSRKPSIGGIEETLEPLNTVEGEGDDISVDITKVEKSDSRKSSVASGAKAELSSSLDVELKEDESTAPELALEAQVISATVPIAEAALIRAEPEPKDVSSRKSSVAEAPSRKSSIAAEVASKKDPETESASSKPPSRKSSTVSEKELIVAEVGMEGTEAQSTGIETTDLDTVEEELLKSDADGAQLETSHEIEDKVVVTPSSPVVKSRSASIQDSSNKQPLQGTEAQEEVYENILTPSVTLKEELEGSEKSSPVLDKCEVAQGEQKVVDRIEEEEGDLYSEAIGGEPQEQVKEAEISNMAEQFTESAQASSRIYCSAEEMPSAHIRRSIQIAEQVLYEEPEDDDSVAAIAGTSGSDASLREEPIVATTVTTTQFPAATSAIVTQRTFETIEEAPSGPSDLTIVREYIEQEVISEARVSLLETLEETARNSGDGKPVTSRMVTESVDESKSVKTIAASPISVTTSCTTTDTTSSRSTEVAQPSNEQDNRKATLEDWGKPLKLPSPPEPGDGGGVRRAPSGTRSTARAAVPSNKAATGDSSTTTTRTGPRLGPGAKPAKSASSTTEAKDPVYMDLAYVPHHGDLHYCNADFFKRVRARYYVFSGVNPSREVFEALIEGKKTWGDDQAPVTVIPTHETDTLGYWMSLNQEQLEKYRIDVAPPANRCTVTLQDHETSCAAYRLEF